MNRLLSSCIALAAAAAAVAQTPYAYWKADGNTLDSAGSNNGVAVGTVGYTAGEVGQGWLLQGNGYINVPNPDAGGLQDPNGFTVSAWIDMTSVSTTFGTGSIVNLRSSSNSTGFTMEELYQNPNTISFAVNTSGTTSYNTISSGGWNFGTFYLATASYDAASGTMKLYQDGSLVASQNVGANTPMTTDPASLFEMGNNIVNGSEFNGVIDDVKFFQNALTDQQVKSLVPEPGVGFAFTAGLGLTVLRRRRR